MRDSMTRHRTYCTYCTVLCCIVRTEYSYSYCPLHSSAAHPPYKWNREGCLDTERQTDAVHFTLPRAEQKHIQNARARVCERLITVQYTQYSTIMRRREEKRREMKRREESSLMLIELRVVSTYCACNVPLLCVYVLPFNAFVHCVQHNTVHCTLVYGPAGIRHHEPSVIQRKLGRTTFLNYKLTRSKCRGLYPYVQ